MGATNSNHFPPQSDNWFAHYHARPHPSRGVYRPEKRHPGGSSHTEQAARDARFASFFRACEVEALTHEAVAQHYLQDSWSAGHMWERWGTTTLDAFPEVLATGAGSADATWNGLDTRFRKLLVAEMVAISAGTIHGSDPLFFETVPGGFTLHDALCYPTEEVKAVKGGSIYNVVGDSVFARRDRRPARPRRHLAHGPPLRRERPLQQSQGLLNCAAGSVGQVYTALKGQGTSAIPSSARRWGAPPCSTPPPAPPRGSPTPRCTRASTRRTSSPPPERPSRSSSATSPAPSSPPPATTTAASATRRGSPPSSKTAPKPRPTRPRSRSSTSPRALNTPTSSATSSAPARTSSTRPKRACTRCSRSSPTAAPRAAALAAP
ncbi:MAG: hypothetical protein R3B70_37190 [Polyangiaceae bacterium]